MQIKIKLQKEIIRWYLTQRRDLVIKVQDSLTKEERVPSMSYKELNTKQWAKNNWGRKNQRKLYNQNQQLTKRIKLMTVIVNLLQIIFQVRRFQSLMRAIFRLRIRPQMIRRCQWWSKNWIIVLNIGYQMMIYLSREEGRR